MFSHYYYHSAPERAFIHLHFYNKTLLHISSQVSLSCVLTEPLAAGNLTLLRVRTKPTPGELLHEMSGWARRDGATFREKDKQRYLQRNQRRLAHSKVVQQLSAAGKVHVLNSLETGNGGKRTG